MWSFLTRLLGLIPYVLPYLLGKRSEERDAEKEKRKESDIKASRWRNRPNNRVSLIKRLRRKKD